MCAERSSGSEQSKHKYILALQSNFSSVGKGTRLIRSYTDFSSDFGLLSNQLERATRSGGDRSCSTRKLDFFHRNILRYKFCSLTWIETIELAEQDLSPLRAVLLSPKLAHQRQRFNPRNVLPVRLLTAAAVAWHWETSKGYVPYIGTPL